MRNTIGRRGSPRDKGARKAKIEHFQTLQFYFVALKIEENPRQVYFTILYAEYLKVNNLGFVTQGCRWSPRHRQCKIIFTLNGQCHH